MSVVRVWPATGDNRSVGIATYRAGTSVYYRGRVTTHIELDTGATRAGSQLCDHRHRQASTARECALRLERVLLREAPDTVDTASEARIQHNRDVATARQITDHVTSDDARRAMNRLLALAEYCRVDMAATWLVELMNLADLANNKKNAPTRH